MTKEEIIEELTKQISVAGSQKAWAQRNGFSPAFINDILQGRREFTSRLAESLGYERRIIFVLRQSKSRPRRDGST